MQLDFNDTLEIVRNCVNAGRADLIEEALFGRLSISDLRAKFEAEYVAPAKAAAKPAAGTRSIFGDGPTPEQRDALAAAIKRRFEAETKRS
jgi:hypothetical protein